MALLAPNTPAPAFELPDQDGKLVKLSDFKGKSVVIYFYPRALTPGCTVQACALRDGLDEFAQRNVVVLGISPDKPKVLKKFETQEDLNFRLLSDESHSVAESYGAWQEKSMYGKKYMGMARISYLISPAGTILHVLPKVDPKTHYEALIKLIDADESAKS
jgi:peroxiredoxin Q/BCP